jgi:hypothetical protein
MFKMYYEDIHMKAKQMRKVGLWFMIWMQWFLLINGINSMNRMK